MPRDVFDVDDGGARLDDEGCNCTSLPHARDVAFEPRVQPFRSEIDRPVSGVLTVTVREVGPLRL
ncbi:hypothetical protein [Methylobacterium gnaphalii]|uniref:Uncharacterized protein n=1 Tax=Methylobacterium gnaphalii TaxID=1010610 RepID=A0A512JE97_9HYPH|nr:hypothetical protein [Methylobacterium gnaphalii]GEP08270.1 hypothetical protein MGN01_01150 [Methylobacterium gnaphalii]GJD67954.1 hypothetical protein MMMDOFMJ_0872 [Methylobacterium gnaphalii]GLS51099.1 hypothetical protein GCM10007885_39530 [Methylobacterium gnaphalii]